MYMLIYLYVNVCVVYMYMYVHIHMNIHIHKQSLLLEYRRQLEQDGGMGWRWVVGSIFIGLFCKRAL